jgi:DNA repair protein RadC
MDFYPPLILKDLPLRERPRERLIKYGAGALSDSELLAIVLRTGTVNENVIDLSKRIISQYNLQGLCSASLAELKRFKGINNAKACQILAVVELSKRISLSAKADNTKIKNSGGVYDLLYQEMRFEKKESFVGLYLDSRNNLLKKEIISIGTLNTSVVHPRELFRTAILESANSIIIVHNHPSGDPTPSKEDLELTKLLIAAGKLIGIPLLDHIIIGEKKYFSMADRNILCF